MRISLIVAMAENRVIGVDNRMPWHLSADLQRFRRITLGKPILMGRRTHQSIGRPLPGRRNILLTSDPGFVSAGCEVVHSLEAALAAADGADELMVIGGASLYRELLPRADRLYLTLIHHVFDGDTFFPEVDWTEWRESARQEVMDDPASGLHYSFIDYARASCPADAGHGSGNRI
ncbi:MAG: dihydrofolate reductase [Chloroflexi bacterium]|nr:dihydrofolate reductase [Chloroflexota bacterium]